MTIQDLGSVGEFVAAIATLVTLAYLAVQVRQNTKSLAESTSASINEGFASINSRISSDEKFAELFLRGRQDINSLNPVELERFRAFIQDILNIAVYSDGLEASHHSRSLHFDAFNVMVGLYNTYPGIRAVLDSLEPSTPRDLIERFRQSSSSYFMIERDGNA